MSETENATTHAYKNPHNIEFKLAGGSVSCFKSTDGITYLSFYDLDLNGVTKHNKTENVDEVDYVAVACVAIPDRLARSLANLLMMQGAPKGRG